MSQSPICWDWGSSPYNYFYGDNSASKEAKRMTVCLRNGLIVLRTGSPCIYVSKAFSLRAVSAMRTTRM